ncbi:hypothetical protein ACP70R_028074 [Stipagrostis hirtigluma subsp. patula]
MSTETMEVAADAGDETPAKECTRSGCRSRTNDVGGHGAPPGFDCGVCLEPAAEPVATRCGHLYCRPCLRRWLRSGQPGAGRCPVCSAAVSEDRLVPLYGRGRANVERREDDDVGDRIENHHEQQQIMEHRGWMLLHSNAGCVIGGAAVAVLPWAFPGGRLPVTPRPVIACDGWRRRRVEDALHQIWLFLAASAVLCFLLP